MSTFIAGSATTDLPPVSVLTVGALIFTEDGQYLMQRVAPDLGRRVGIATTNQYNNKFNNPFGVRP